MGISIGGELPPTKDRAAAMLSELIKREYGIEIAPWALIEFVNAKWYMLNHLVHAIHQEFERYEGRVI